MTQLEELQAKVAELSQTVADSGAKVDVLIVQNDALISLADNISAQLVALGESGQIPAPALSDLIASIDNAKTAALAIGTKAADETTKVVDAISKDTPPAPAPTPAPAETSDGGGTPGESPSETP